MNNFEKRVVIHDGKEVPSDDRYCLVLLKNGIQQRAFYNRKWFFCEGHLYREEEVKAWLYIEDLFEAPKNIDIRLYIDEKEGCV